VISEIARFGTVKRVHGDWTTTRLAGWKTAASEHVIQPRQFANTVRKNATRALLIIDAMDLLTRRQWLLHRVLRATSLGSRPVSERTVWFGFGEQGPPSVPQACDIFTYLEVLGGEVEEIVAAPHAPCGRISEQHEAGRAAGLRFDRVWRGRLGEPRAGRPAQRKQQPDFDPGISYAKLSDLIREIDLFDIGPWPSGGLQIRNKRQVTPFAPSCPPQIEIHLDRRCRCEAVAAIRWGSEAVRITRRTGARSSRSPGAR
jgi:hypothetical protein